MKKLGFPWLSYGYRLTENLTLSLSLNSIAVFLFPSPPPSLCMSARLSFFYSFSLSRVRPSILIKRSESSNLPNSVGLCANKAIFLRDLIKTEAVLFINTMIRLKSIFTIYSFLFILHVHFTLVLIRNIYISVELK